MERVWRAEVEIPASRDAVWAVLTDFPAYPAWNPFTREVRCDGTIGSPVRMKVDLGWAGVTRQKEILRELAPYRIVWTMEVGADALIGAKRTQELTELPGGGTRYVTIDRIFGLFSPVVGLLFNGALTAGFNGMAAGLAAEVQRRAG
jgi:uncharacterized protein YndB with AHSA1/START domain